MTHQVLSRRMPFFSDKRHNTMSKAPDSKQILALKARAHHLNPVVMIGQHGLTDSVIKETDAALSAHQLIKVRVAGDDRAERVQIAAALCEAADAHLVQHIGKLLVLWREKQDEE
ncbi:RNA-binding protein YhbY [Neisseria bacilliformis ATCC BAA-1200]|uniref:RNA-binding protein YhbY n=2 Tax=Neisseria TaxID=482 RepID=F2BFK4_9NEIS|nr:RNA-binding protein YhbY [Neisseria bacilliformis ATCC BAA-1200]